MSVFYSSFFWLSLHVKLCSQNPWNKKIRIKKNVILFRQQANYLCPFKNVSIIEQSPGNKALPGFTPITVKPLTTKFVNQAKTIPWFSRVLQSKFEANRSRGVHELWSDIQTSYQRLLVYTLYKYYFGISA